MSDRKPIEADRYWDEVHFECSCCLEHKVRELEAYTAQVEKQRDIAVEALEGIISCVENPLTSHQDIAEYCEKVSRETINQIGE